MPNSNGRLPQHSLKIVGMTKKLPPHERKAFAHRLISARESAGYAEQIEFAAALGISGARYGRWERAETEPDIAMLAKIQRLTETSLDILIAGERPVVRFEQEPPETAGKPTLHETRQTFHPALKKRRTSKPIK